MSSRTSNSVRNTSVNFITQIVTIIASFVTRSVFIYALGKTFLGVSGLFSDILQLLSLAELGVGTAILYEMYRPIANNDEKKSHSPYELLWESIYNNRMCSYCNRTCHNTIS